jgi:hypothetical protein
LLLSFQVSEPDSPGRHRVVSPQQLAGRAVQSRDEIANAAVAPGGADHDLVLDGQWRRRERQVGLAVAHIGFPGDLTGFLVAGDDARRKRPVRAILRRLMRITRDDRAWTAQPG